MSYTLVYDRRFLKCGDRYIPMALYGDNNVTQINWQTGREARVRNWGVFVYSDQMLLATEEEILSVVNQYHPKDSHAGESFTFHGKWLNDAETYRFYQNGIREAVTIEDIVFQTYESAIGELRVYQKDFDLDKTLSLDRCYLHTTEELTSWIEKAKSTKDQILHEGKAKYAYICLGYSTQLPLKVSCVKNRDVPLIAYDRKSRRGKRSYLKSVADSSCSYTNNVSEALVFSSIEDAYMTIPLFLRTYVGFMPADRAKMAVKEKGNYSLTVLHKGARVYIMKKTRNTTYFTVCPGTDTKRFQTEAQAIKWYRDKLAGKTAFTDPQAVLLNA